MKREKAGGRKSEVCADAAVSRRRNVVNKPPTVASPLPPDSPTKPLPHKTFSLSRTGPADLKEASQSFAVVVKPRIYEVTNDAGNGFPSAAQLIENPGARCMYLGGSHYMAMTVAALPNLSPSAPRVVPAPYPAAPGRSLHAWRRCTRRPSSVCRQAGRQAGRKAVRQAGTQADRQVGK